MDLARQQAALSRLYTRSDLLDKFLADPAGLAADLQLTPEDALQLAATAGIGLRRYAHSLVGKRLMSVQQELPLTRAYLGPQFDQRFREFARGHPAGKVSPYDTDGREFVSSLLQGDGAILELWLRDVVRYEGDWLAARRTASRCKIRLYRHRVANLRWSRSNEPPRPPEPGWTLVLWWRAKPAGPLSYWWRQW